MYKMSTIPAYSSTQERAHSHYSQEIGVHLSIPSHVKVLIACSDAVSCIDFHQQFDDENQQMNGSSDLKRMPHQLVIVACQ